MLKHKIAVLDALSAKDAAKHFDVTVKTIHRWREKCGLKDIRKRKRYTETERANAVALAKKLGCRQAGRALGICKDSINRWTNEERRKRKELWNATKPLTSAS